MIPAPYDIVVTIITTISGTGAMILFVRWINK